MNSTAYKPRTIRSPYVAKQYQPVRQAPKSKAFNFQDERNPVRAEIQKCIGTHQLTAVISEDTETLEAMRSVEGLISFLCTLSKNGRVISQGRGSAVLSRTNKYVERAIYSALNSSLADAIIRSTKVLDTFRGTSEIEQSRMALDEAYQMRGAEESEQATEKQKNYLAQLIQVNVADEDEREQQIAQIDDLTKQEASALIESFRQ